MRDYKDIIKNYYYHGNSIDYIMGYLQCLYVNSLIKLNKFYELNYYTNELYKKGI